MTDLQLKQLERRIEAIKYEMNSEEFMINHTIESYYSSEFWGSSSYHSESDYDSYGEELLEELEELQTQLKQYV
jgi:hypothetical protein